MANDIHMNPGPHFQSNFFNFMNWNLNSLAEEKFERVRLIEAHNSVFNYDVISIMVGLNFLSKILPEKICLLMN